MAWKGEGVAWKGGAGGMERDRGGGVGWQGRGGGWEVTLYCSSGKSSKLQPIAGEYSVQYSVQYRYTVFLRKIDTSLKLLLSRGRTTNNLVVKILFCFAKLLGFFMVRSFVYKN